jgi:hypothetical protein
MSVQQRNMYDLAVAYRIYPKVSEGAKSLPFGDDKLQQAEICLRSFRNSLGSLRVKIWAILDGCPREYRSLFERYFPSNDLVIVDVNRIGNLATYQKQLDILLSQDDAQAVYFAEDDYLYLAGQFPTMLRFLHDDENVDFISPYDHPDCYFLSLHRQPKWIRVFEGHHWRSGASTCLTFLARKDALARYERTLRAYSRGSGDCAMWLSLTKSRVFNPLALLKFSLRRESSYCKEILKAWLFCWRQIVFGKSANLWIPLPGFATHLCAGLVSPGFDVVSLMQEEAVTERSQSAALKC